MQNDYILKMIEQFAQAIVSIILRRKAGENKEAIEQIQSASRYYLKIELETLLGYSPEQMANHFRDPKNRLDTQKCVLCADLLYEFALICEGQKQIIAAKHIKKSCLYLYKIGVPEEKQFQLPYYFDRIAALERELKD